MRKYTCTKKRKGEKGKQHCYSFIPCFPNPHTALVFIVIPHTALLLQTQQHKPSAAVCVCLVVCECEQPSAGVPSSAPSDPAAPLPPWAGSTDGIAVLPDRSGLLSSPLHPVRAQPPAARLNYCRRSRSPREARARARVRWGVTQLSLERLKRRWLRRGQGEPQSGARLCSRCAEVLRLELR